MLPNAQQEEVERFFLSRHQDIFRWLSVSRSEASHRYPGKPGRNNGGGSAGPSRRAAEKAPSAIERAGFRGWFASRRRREHGEYDERGRGGGRQVVVHLCRSRSACGYYLQVLQQRRDPDHGNQQQQGNKSEYGQLSSQAWCWLAQQLLYRRGCVVRRKTRCGGGGRAGDGGNGGLAVQRLAGLAVAVRRRRRGQASVYDGGWNVAGAKLGWLAYKYGGGLASILYVGLDNLGGWLGSASTVYYSW